MPTNIRGSGDSKRELERHTGADGYVKFDLTDADLDTSSDSLTGDYSGAIEIPVENIDWNRSFDTNDVQHNGSLAPTLTTTGVRFDGSFEYTGQNPDLMELMARANTSAGPRKHRPIRGTLTLIEHNHDGLSGQGDTAAREQKITFSRVLITDVSRDYPSDDSTSVTVDWEAEDMTQSNL